MVAMSMHFIIGILLVYFLGIKDNRKYLLALWAIAPDLDGIFFALLLLIKNIFGISLAFMAQQQWIITIFAHRGFSHSLLLFAFVIIILWLFKSKYVKLISILWLSHLLIDYITAWKLFPFLPFSYISTHLGIVEVFDSFLVLFTTIILAFFIGSSFNKKEKKTLPIAAYILVIVTGFIPSIFMGEFNIQTVILSQAVFWIIVIMFIQTKEKIQNFAAKGIHITTLIMCIYVTLLIGTQAIYAVQIQTSMSNIEPLEEFAFNYNAHTYEIDQGDTYKIGLISWMGIEEEKIIPKVNNQAKIENEVVENYMNAYDKALCGYLLPQNFEFSLLFV